MMGKIVFFILAFLGVLFIIVLVLLVVLYDNQFEIGVVIDERINEKDLRRRQEKCYSIFIEQFPSSKLCPGKYNDIYHETDSLCLKCDHYKKHYEFNVDDIPEEEKIVNKFK